jgi:hypothetical protein
MVALVVALVAVVFLVSWYNGISPEQLVSALFTSERQTDAQTQVQVPAPARAPTATPAPSGTASWEELERNVEALTATATPSSESTAQPSSSESDSLEQLKKDVEDLKQELEAERAKIPAKKTPTILPAQQGSFK